MQRMFTYVPAIMLLTSVLAGCGDDDTPSVDAETAQVAMTALSASTQEAVIDYGNESGPITLDCARGGSRTVDGDVLVEVDPVRVDVEVGVDYDDCATGGDVELDGTVDFSQQVAVGGGETVRVETTFAGDVVFSGDIEAVCVVDVHVLVDLTGRLISVEGRACGHDAAEFDLTIMPHWQ